MSLAVTQTSAVTAQMPTSESQRFGSEVSTVGTAAVDVMRGQATRQSRQGVIAVEWLGSLRGAKAERRQ